MRNNCVIVLLALFIATTPAAIAADKHDPDPIWQGQIHLGDNPEAYSKITSAGMGFQVPFKVEAAKTYKLIIKASDVETLAGDGHFAEVYAHFQKDNKTEEVRLKVFRIKDDSGKEKDYSFEFAAKTDRQVAPDYYSVKIKVDTSIPFGLWDDFLVKRITVEQVEKK